MIGTFMLMIVSGTPLDQTARGVFFGESHEDANLFPARVETRKDESGTYIPMWGTDILVRSGFSGLTDLAMDVDNSGRVYVAVFLNHSTENDSIEIWQSPDGGYTWTHLYSLYEPASDGGMNEIDLVVGNGSNPYIYTFIVYDNEGPDNDAGIWLNKRRVDGSGNVWMRLTSDTTDEHLTASINSSEVLMIGYRKSGNRIYVMYSTDSASTWDTSYVSLGNRNWPSVHITDDGYGLITYTADDTIIRVGVYSNNFNSISFQDINPSCDNLRHTSITGDGSGNFMVVWSNYHSSSNVWDVHYAYSTDHGATWSTAPFPPMNFSYGDRDAIYPSVDYNVGFRFVTTLIGSTYDTVYYAYSSTVNGWSSSNTTINDYDATTVMGAQVARTSNAGGGIVVYRQYGSGNVWIDGYSYTASDETKPTDNVSIRIEGSMLRIINRTTNPADIKVFSSSGKLITRTTISSEGTIRMPHSGIYHLEINDGTSRATRTVIIY